MPYADPASYDLALEDIRQNVQRATFCTAEPTSYAEATTLVSQGGVMLAERTGIDASNLALAAGDVSGRKVTLDSSGFQATEGGSAAFVCLLDDANSKRKLTGEATDDQGNPMVLEAGKGYNNGVIDFTIPDPVTA